MRVIAEQPPLGSNVDAGPQRAFLTGLRTQLFKYFAEMAFRLNRVNPKDGSEFQRMLDFEPYTAADISAQADDWDPSGAATGSAAGRYTLYRVDVTGGPQDLTGMVDDAPDQAVQQGRAVYIANISGANSLTVKHEDANSAAGNRFTLPAGADKKIDPGGCLGFFYDGTDSRWRALGWS